MNTKQRKLKRARLHSGHIKPKIFVGCFVDVKPGATGYMPHEYRPGQKIKVIAIDPKDNQVLVYAKDWIISGHSANTRRHIIPKEYTNSTNLWIFTKSQIRRVL